MDFQIHNIVHNSTTKELKERWEVNIANTNLKLLFMKEH